MTFPDFCRSYGVIPPEVITRGKFISCGTELNPRKKSGRIKLSDDGLVGWVWNYKGGDRGEWRPDSETAPKPRDYAAENAERSERLAKRQAEEKAGTDRALAEYNAATALVGATHPYCVKKMLTMDACRGLKVDSRGNLLIPMLRRSKFISLQRIALDGSKKFATGAPSKGGMLEITRPRYSMTILCEGFATGATIFSACIAARVIVCFSAENLVTVAENNEWSGLVAIAADNDRDTKENTGKNPGIECAERAAKIIGCGVAIPYPENGTDWQDVLAEQFARLQAAEESKPWKTSPHKLRASALAFVAPAMMRASKMVCEK